VDASGSGISACHVRHAARGCRMTGQPVDRAEGNRHDLQPGLNSVDFA
jgi:hypothetical protein